MNILVVGSKPDVIYPNARQDIILGVNGAIERASHLGDQHKAAVWGLISGYALQNENILNLIRGTTLDRLIIIPSGDQDSEKLTPHAFGLLCEDCEIVPRKAREKIIGRVIGVRNLVKSMCFLYGVVPSLSRLVRFYTPFVGRGRLLRISNGAFGVAYMVTKLHREFRMSDNWFLSLSGVGVESGSGHFYDETAAYGVSHTQEDARFMSTLRKKYGPHHFYVTDKSLDRVLS